MTISEQVHCDRCAAPTAPEECVMLMQMGAGKHYRLRDATPSYRLELCHACVVALREWLSKGHP